MYSHGQEDAEYRGLLRLLVNLVLLGNIIYVQEDLARRKHRGGERSPPAWSCAASRSGTTAMCVS